MSDDEQVDDASVPAHGLPVPPPPVSAAELRARAGTKRSGVAGDCGVPIPDLSRLPLGEVLDSGDFVLAKSLRRVLRGLSEPGEVYAGHGGTPVACGRQSLRWGRSLSVEHPSWCETAECLMYQDEQFHPTPPLPMHCGRWVPGGDRDGPVGVEARLVQFAERSRVFVALRVTEPETRQTFYIGFEQGEGLGQALLEITTQAPVSLTPLTPTRTGALP